MNKLTSREERLVDHLTKVIAQSWFTDKEKNLMIDLLDQIEALTVGEDGDKTNYILFLQEFRNRLHGAIDRAKEQQKGLFISDKQRNIDEDLPIE